MTLAQYRDPDHAERYGKRRGTTRAELRALDVLLGAVPDGVVILDLPCGNGRLGPHLRARSPARLIGIDGSLEMVARAGAPYDARAVADAAALPLRDASADLVVCMRLLHHFPSVAERVGILAELARVSRGLVLVSYYDSRTLEGLRRRLRPKRASARHGVPASRMRADLRAAGLEPLRRRSLLPLVREQTLWIARPAV